LLRGYVLSRGFALFIQERDITLGIMKWVLKLLLILVSSLCLSLAQPKNASSYVIGNAEADAAMVTFYLENVSNCQLDTVDVRVAHNSVYFTTDEASLHVELAPTEVGTFAMRLSQVVNSDWQWVIDGVTLSNCTEAGQINFEKHVFGKPQTAAVEASQPTSAQTMGGRLVYTISKGDTVFIIADKFGITARELMNANGLTSEALIFGRTLNIPIMGSTTFTSHTVASGDTLYSLSQHYGVDIAVLEKANCLGANSVLLLGNQLRIPPAGVTDVAMTCR
jgi:LysM repeat protein